MSQNEQKSVKGQLLVLKRMIKDFKDAHQKQQMLLTHEGSVMPSHQALDNMLSHVINIGVAVDQEELSANTVD